MAVSQETLPVQISSPDIIQRHNISDEELDMLCDGKKDMVLEFLWISIGAVIGSIPTAFTGMSSYFQTDTTTKMPLDSLLQILIFWIAVTVSSVVGVIAFKRGKRANTLQEEIRQRSEGCGED